LFEGGAHPDYFDIHPEEGSEVIKVDQVRAMISSLDLTTSVSRRKVAFIHPAETMNSASANALLKSLEEPAGDTVLILVSHHPGRLPITIRSRCQVISVSQPDRQLVLDWLVGISGKSADHVGAAIQAAGGSPLRADQYLDSPQLDAFDQVREGLANLLGRPGAVSMVSSKLNELEPVDLWRWLSACTGEVIKSSMTGSPLKWLPDNIQLGTKALLELQRQADINRQMSATSVRGDLLLQDWLVRWSEQVL
jgi:DNA polymerase-3 subunit delta'